MFNPVKLTRAGLKQYNRSHYVSFRRSDVGHVGQQWMLNLKTATVTTNLNHIYKIEETYKNSDVFTEQLEEDLVDDDDDDELNFELEENLFICYCFVLLIIALIITML